MLRIVWISGFNCSIGIFPWSVVIGVPLGKHVLVIGVGVKEYLTTVPLLKLDTYKLPGLSKANPAGAANPVIRLESITPPFELYLPIVPLLKLDTYKLSDVSKANPTGVTNPVIRLASITPHSNCIYQLYHYKI